MPRAKKKEAEAPAEAVTETVQRMPLSQLHPFEGHPCCAPFSMTCSYPG